jgi:predicted Fe-Mo cluster-binding NifX family protein
LYTCFIGGDFFMKIAIPYDRENETVFQHMGRTEFFKVYEVIDDEIDSWTIFSTEGVAHEALVGGLYEIGVSVLLCGGLGDGMIQALKSVGIKVYPGNTGKADEVLFAYLDGDLKESTVPNCSHEDHHGEEGCSCGGNCQCVDINKD